jgi:hypothetical protein
MQLDTFNKFISNNLSTSFQRSLHNYRQDLLYEYTDVGNEESYSIHCTFEQNLYVPQRIGRHRTKSHNYPSASERQASSQALFPLNYR